MFPVPGGEFLDRWERGHAVVGGHTGVVRVVAVGRVLGGRLVVVARIVGVNAVSEGESKEIFENEEL